MNETPILLNKKASEIKQKLIEQQPNTKTHGNILLFECESSPPHCTTECLWRPWLKKIWQTWALKVIWASTVNTSESTQREREMNDLCQKWFYVRIYYSWLTILYLVEAIFISKHWVKLIFICWFIFEPTVGSKMEI